MKLETENEEIEIANTGAAFCWRTRLNLLECAHCRSIVESISIPAVPSPCLNVRSAWSQEVLTYADGSRIPVIIDPYRCYCSACLADRARPTPPARYQGSNRRCRVCGAVDGVPYAKFASSLCGRVKTETCELYRGLCNRPACKRNRRFQGEIPDVPCTHDKGSYPSGYAGTEALIHKSLLKWSSHPTSKANNKTCKARYGEKILGASAPVEGTRAIFWIQAKDPDRLFQQHTASRLDFGPATKSPTATDFGISDVEWSRLETKHIRDKYAEHQSLLDLPLPSVGCKIKKVNAELPPAYQTPWFIVDGFAPEIEASRAKQWDEEYRSQHTDERNPDYLSKPEISPDRLVTTSRETTRGGYTDETVVIKSISDEEKWRKAILLRFGEKPVDFDFTDGLYMLVERPQQPPRVYLLIDARDFQAPDERVYIGTDQFKTARAVMAKSSGFAVQSLVKCPSRVLSFKQSGAEIKVTISDCEMFEDENMGKKMSRAKQLMFNQQVVAENVER